MSPQKVRPVPTFVMALLIVAAVTALLWTWLGGRRHHDPRGSVNTFRRALDAMGTDQTPRPRSGHESDPSQVRR